MEIAGDDTRAAIKLVEKIFTENPELRGALTTYVAAASAF